MLGFRGLQTIWLNVPISPPLLKILCKSMSYEGKETAFCSSGLQHFLPNYSNQIAVFFSSVFLIERLSLTLTSHWPAPCVTVYDAKQRGSHRPA